MVIDSNLIERLKDYVNWKTGKNYFGHIKSTPKNIMVSCPYHKGGQENKPSCGIKTYSDDKGVMGHVHCFTCGKTTDLVNMLKDILGNSFNESEIETKFNLQAELLKEQVLKSEKVGPVFKIPDKTHIGENQLRQYREYHPYLQYRKININTADMYDIGYDSYNEHITFPIKDIYNRCIGIGRRSIKEKKYIYPEGMVKPLYGVYELPKYIRHLWVVEGPFNLWSLFQYGKTGVALLGTGTQHQYDCLLNINCLDYVLALDGDDAGHKGIKKLGNHLIKNNKKVFVACVPDNKDINDMSDVEFYNMSVIPYLEWKKYFN